MATATRHCDECEHCQELNFRRTTPCSLGHRPRFYQPTSEGDMSWGWKRKCEDFKDRENGHPDRHP